MSRKQAPLSTKVRNLLMAGYGVEDIALKLRANLEDVRFAVRMLRSEGELDKIYRPWHRVEKE